MKEVKYIQLASGTYFRVEICKQHEKSCRALPTPPVPWGSNRKLTQR